jgi:hypothetical protein
LTPIAIPGPKLVAEGGEVLRELERDRRQALSSAHGSISLERSKRLPVCRSGSLDACYDDSFKFTLYPGVFRTVRRALPNPVRFSLSIDSVYVVLSRPRGERRRRNRKAARLAGPLLPKYKENRQSDSDGNARNEREHT